MEELRVLRRDAQADGAPGRGLQGGGRLREDRGVGGMRLPLQPVQRGEGGGRQHDNESPKVSKYVRLC